MSYREAQQWASYVRAHGPISRSRRIESMLAQVCWVIQAVHGGKMSPSDFLPGYGSVEDEEPEATIEQFAAILSMARIN